MDYRVRGGLQNVNRLRDLIDVDSSTADEEGEDRCFLIYDHDKQMFVFSNRLDANPDNDYEFA
jgi:hypothetical protein